MGIARFSKKAAIAALVIPSIFAAIPGWSEESSGLVPIDLFYNPSDQGIVFALEKDSTTRTGDSGVEFKPYGFVETDLISDTVEGINEEEDNPLLPKSNTYAGRHQRTQMSVRNSRLGFDLKLPKTQSGVAVSGKVEIDFLGNSAENQPPDAALPASQTERDFFNNPSPRIRHAFVDIGYEDWTAKFGQYWSLLGWQPYYFPGEAVVAPTPGQLYRRFAQNRYTYARDFADHWRFEGAADYAKPAQMDSGLPIFQAGARISSTERKAVSINGTSTGMVGLSAAASFDFIPVRTAFGSANGSAVAIDAAVPLIESADGKEDRSNNLMLMGEFLSGGGVGGLEYAGLTEGIPGVNSSVSGCAALPCNGGAVDSGIAGINAAGNMELIRFQVFRAHIQYSLKQWAASAGYAQVEGRNLRDFAASAGIAPKIQFGYASLFYDPTAWLRFAFEFNQTRDTYNDNSARFAVNNRFQFTTFFIF